MTKYYKTIFSKSLNKDMNLAVYGAKGLPVLAFPTQDSLCRNLEEFGMIGVMSEWIDEGKIQVFVVDSVDRESWSDLDGDKAHRILVQEQYFHFIVDELIPYIRETNGSDRKPLVTGFSMGGMHTAIAFLRRPDLFAGMLAVSGVYGADYFYGDYMDPILADNTPIEYIRNMPEDHPNLSLYSDKKMIFCVGQGAWEEYGVRTLRVLEACMKEKGIPAVCDYWGTDVYHDWCWWEKMILRYMPGYLDE